MTSTLARAATNGSLSLPGEWTETALLLPEGLSYSEWEQIGTGIDRFQQSWRWWYGDWYGYGERHYHGQHSQALLPGDPAVQEKMDAAWVSKKVQISVRNRDLSWSHHRRVAPFDEPDEQEAWLTKALAEGWTADELRREIAHAGRVEKVLEERERSDGTGTALVDEASWEVWLPEQADCDLLLTDPPYMTDVFDIEAFARAWLPVALAKVKPTGRAYVCVGAYPKELAAYLAVPTGHMKLANVLVWTYRNTLGPQPKHDYKLNWQAVLYYRGPEAPALDCPQMVEQFSVQDLNAPDGRVNDRWHAWQKPDALAERFVRHATAPGDRVLDPFAGTGTFLLAAARLGREAAGCDNDPEMLKIAGERGCHVADA